MTTSHPLLRELELLPRDGHRRDLVAGRLIDMPPAWPESSRVALQLGFYLEAFRRDRARDALVIFGSDAGFRIAEPMEPGGPPVIVSPDPSAVARSKLPSDRPTGFWHVVPDLAVEVVSPSDRWRDVQDKVRAYQDAGVSTVWVLDSASRSATVYARNNKPQTLRSPSDALETDALPGFNLAPGDVFG